MARARRADAAIAIAMERRRYAAIAAEGKPGVATFLLQSTSTRLRLRMTHVTSLRGHAVSEATSLCYGRRDCFAAARLAMTLAPSGSHRS